MSERHNEPKDTTMNATMTKDEAVKALADIGSVYVGGSTGWKHADPVQGKALVKQLRAANNALPQVQDQRPAAWGRKGERGTIICIHCGKRGQDHGNVCDHCGHAL
jgi:hypothetical protein